MAHARTSGFIRRGSSNRRKTGWSGGPQEAGASLTAAGAALWSVGSAINEDGLTQVRLRGEYTAFLSVVTTIGDGFSAMAVGMCYVLENAFGIGITAVPTPLADIAWDGWLYHRLHGNIFGQSTTELATGPIDAFRVEIDSKAMRKTRFSDILVGVVELGTETGTATLVFGGQTRVLDKLP